MREADLEGPPPAAEPAQRPANLGDLDQANSEIEWWWESYLPRAQIVGIAAFEGIGKTRFAMDLARRIYLHERWPDRQDPTFPKGTGTLWICADGQQDELAETAKSFGIPKNALHFNTTPDEPYGGTEIDSPEDRERLERNMLQVGGLTFIDSLTNATSLDLCKQTDVKILMTPLRDIVQRTRMNIIPLLHLSREGQALGRRIRGITRILMHLECPDPQNPSRLRLWVEKSSRKKPVALGVTMTDTGNDYDFNPPYPPEPNKGGRAPEKRDKARDFIRAALTGKNDQKAAALCLKWEDTRENKNAFWSARDLMVEAGELVCEGKPFILHLIR
jgi:hypothetical protein